MILLPFEITLTEPVVVTSPFGDDFTARTLSYLPGSALLGVAVQAGGWDGALFANVSFGPAYPVRSGLSIDESFPIPASWQCLKSDPNSLVDLATDSPTEQTVPLGAEFGCNFGDHLELIHPRRQAVVHLDRDRIAGTSTKTDGTIFRYESLSELERFRGTIACSDEKTAKRIKALLDGKCHSFGRSSTAEYGRGRLAILETESCTLTEGGWLYVVAPVLARNPDGFQDGSLAALMHSVGLEVDHVEKAFIRTTRVSGFSSVAQMPLDRVVAIDKGSLVKLKSGVGYSEEYRWFGAGDRAAEGYGRIASAPPTMPATLQPAKSRGKSLLIMARGEDAPEFDNLMSGATRQSSAHARLLLIRWDMLTEEALRKLAQSDALGADIDLTPNQLQNLRRAVSTAASKNDRDLSAYFKGLGNDAKRQHNASKVCSKPIHDWVRDSVKGIGTRVTRPEGIPKEKWNPNAFIYDYMAWVLENIAKGRKKEVQR